MTSTVDVHVRILPTTESAWRIGPTTVTAARIPPNGSRNTDPFQFTQVHNTTASNYDIFRSLSSMVAQVTLGINMTVLAYGQTGSGKTHTMVGNERDGVFFLAAQVLTREAAASRGTTYVRASLIEIYNENVRDLLADPPREIEVRENPDRQIVLDRTTCTFSTVEELHAIIHRGEQARSVAATNLNMRSSRSHTILTLELVHGADGRRASGQMNLVDLAGSENASRAMTAGTQLREGGFINKSLLALGNVVDAIVDGRAHIPYRESKLTRILQSSLGGNAVTAIICCINPHPQDFDQTVAVLRFAQRAQKIVLHPSVITKHPPQCLIDFTDHYLTTQHLLQNTTQRMLQYGSRCAFEAAYRGAQTQMQIFLHQSTQEINEAVESFESSLRSAMGSIEHEMDHIHAMTVGTQDEISAIKEELHFRKREEEQNQVALIEWEKDAEIQTLMGHLTRMQHQHIEVKEKIQGKETELVQLSSDDIQRQTEKERTLARSYADLSEASRRKASAESELKRQREVHSQYEETQRDLRRKCEVIDQEVTEWTASCVSLNHCSKDHNSSKFPQNGSILSDLDHNKHGTCVDSGTPSAKSFSIAKIDLEYESTPSEVSSSTRALRGKIEYLTKRIQNQNCHLGRLKMYLKDIESSRTPAQLALPHPFGVSPQRRVVVSPNRHPSPIVRSRSALSISTRLQTQKRVQRSISPLVKSNSSAHVTRVNSAQRIKRYPAS